MRLTLANLHSYLTTRENYVPYYLQSPALGWMGMRSQWTHRVPNFQLGHDWRTFMRGASMSFSMMEMWKNRAVGTYGPYGR